jgi:hypothetical protein
MRIMVRRERTICVNIIKILVSKTLLIVIKGSKKQIYPGAIRADGNGVTLELK